MTDEFFDRSEFVGYFRDEAKELLDRIDADVLVLEAGMQDGGALGSTIDSLFRSLHTIKGSAGMLEFTIVQRVAHGLEGGIDLLRSGKLKLDEQLLELIFSGRDLLETLVARAVAGDAATLPEVQRYLALLEAYIEHGGNCALPDLIAPGTVDAQERVELDEVALFEAQVAQMLAEQTAVPAQSVTPAVAASPIPAPVAKAAGDSHSTIRVALERLDLLLDLVGELVINRTRITAISQALQRAVERDGSAAVPLAKDLAAASATLARITNELQESVMKARMVPVGQVFERFPRTVRDLAKTTGKQITLAVSGVETDLDKTIVDQIGEPLMHLVRNCADHGIEKPQVRSAAGKDPGGTIFLKAYHEGNQVIIEVGDDGGGISVERVRARGIERGLIDPNATYADEEIIDLIFAPGFSTNDVVTGISGRGVGMDVVKKSVQDLKGQLDVETVLGQGSTFTIRLPLTLAIIRTLLVRVAHRLFAIPLDVVIESQRIDRRVVRSISGSAVVTLRGQVLPLIDLRSVFSITGSAADDEFVMIVIVAHKGRRFGLVVDNFEGDQEIVIKPLSEVMGLTEYIAGATILGNGAIALILDIASLAGGHNRGEHPHAEHLVPITARPPASEMVKLA